MRDRGIAFLLLSLFLVDPLRAQTIDEGQQLFEAQCSVCHTIGQGTLIGPDLQGVTERRDVAWLHAHILAPSVQREAGDQIAADLVATFGIEMPDLGLAEQEVQAVITYLKAQTTATARTLHPLLLPTLALGALAIAGLTLTGLIAGRKKGVEARL